MPKQRERTIWCILGPTLREVSVLLLVSGTFQSCSDDAPAVLGVWRSTCALRAQQTRLAGAMCDSKRLQIRLSA